MQSRFHLLSSLVVILLLFGTTMTASAQETDGTLTMGQPLIGQIGAAGETLAYTYTLPEARTVALQAVGDTAPPSIRITRNGVTIAEQPNSAGELIVTLYAFLNAGDYTVEASTVNNTSGTVILLVQSETPLTATALPTGTTVNGEVSSAIPVALYTFDALSEPAFLYAESGLTDRGPYIRLLNTTTGRVSGLLDTGLTGGRFRIPVNAASYQVEVTLGGADDSVEPFTLCLTTVSAGGCEAGIEPPVATEAVQVSADCTVEPTAGAVNIRQSADTNAQIIGALTGSSTVLGISPNGAFYNIVFNGVNGWVALSVVTSSGDCANVPQVQPPAVISNPVPPTPVPPTVVPTSVPPTEPPPSLQPQSTPEVSDDDDDGGDNGPCLLTVNNPVFVYTQPTADPSYLQDQVQPPGQLIPTGRLADNSWWQTNYGGAWVQTGVFGGAITVSGNCALPVVTFP